LARLRAKASRPLGEAAPGKGHTKHHHPPACFVDLGIVSVRFSALLTFSLSYLGSATLFLSLCVLCIPKYTEHILLNSFTTFLTYLHILQTRPARCANRLTSLYNMGLTLRSLLLVASATRAFASCAHGTFLRPRAENGTVEVGKFGYSGSIVSPFSARCSLLWESHSY
jgi:hypothetical protein